MSESTTTILNEKEEDEEMDEIVRAIAVRKLMSAVDHMLSMRTQYNDFYYQGPYGAQWAWAFSDMVRLRDSLTRCCQLEVERLKTKKKEKEEE